MPFNVLATMQTPNPNALKFTLDRRAADLTRSYFNAQQAAGDPLAAALFAVAGVTNVLICNDWITVSKSPSATWPAVRAGVERALRDAP